MSAQVDDTAKTSPSIGFLLGICCWNLIVAIDSTALSTALPASASVWLNLQSSKLTSKQVIAHDLHASSTQAFWCGTSFVLCSAAVQPVLASCSDALGRKAIIALALSLFTAGAIICALAQHIAVLILGRVLQGAGGGGLLTMTFVLMADSLTLKQRHKAISVLSLSWLVGPVLGPIISGSFTQIGSWRAIFWFNLPFCVFGFIILFFFIHCDYQTPNTGLERFKQIPYLGSLIFVTSLTSFLVAISWGGTMFAWTAWQTLVPLFLGLSGLFFWIFYSLRLTQTPLIPLGVMNTRTTVISFFGNLIHGLCFYGILYYLPLFYQAVKSYSPIISGVALLPACLTAGPFAALTGLYIAKTNNIKLVTLVGWVIFTIGLALLSLLKSTTAVAVWILITIPSGMGIGVLYAALSLATQASVETASDKTRAEIDQAKSLAAGLNPFFRAVGQAFGIVISQAVFTNVMTRQLGSEIAQDSASLAEVIKSLPKSNLIVEDLLDGFVDSLRAVWYTLVGLAALALLLTFLTKDGALRGKPAGSPDVESVYSSQSAENDDPRRKWSLFGRNEAFFGGVHDGLFVGLNHGPVSLDAKPEELSPRRKWSLFGRHEAFFGGVHDALAQEFNNDDENDAVVQRPEKTWNDKAVIVSVTEVKPARLR